MNKKLMMIGLFLVAMLTGCSHDESPEAVDLGQTNVSAEFVSADEATTIAAAVQFGSTKATTAAGKATTRSAGLNKEVESVTPVPDASGATAFYVINYKGGGFMILSADKRVDPVMAVSETSTFPVNEALYPEGLVDWMTEAKAYVQDIRVKNTPLTEEMKAAWEPSSIQRVAAPSKDREILLSNNNATRNGGCQNYYEGVEQLLTTQWGQTHGFNALLGMVTCPDGSTHRAYAGCVAVAMAQIMKYHRHPSSYNWNNMPDRVATTETAKLIRDIGIAVKMSYRCNGSGARIEDAAAAFRNTFRYPRAKAANFDLAIVRRELKARRPVYLRGGQEGPYGRYTNGHAWVCDGWRIIVTYNANCQPHVNEGLHMNWGYEGSFDAWYTPYDWRPNGSVHNYQKMMIYEIIPS